MKKTDLKIAIAGNPNAGKTTVFNALTGTRQHVANYPGVTVEKKTGFLLGKAAKKNSGNGEINQNHKENRCKIKLIDIIFMTLLIFPMEAFIFRHLI